MLHDEVRILDAVSAVLLLEAAVESGGGQAEAGEGELLFRIGGENPLHSVFPKDPNAEYRLQAETVLTRLELQHLWKKEKERLDQEDVALTSTQSESVGSDKDAAAIPTTRQNSNFMTQVMSKLRSDQCEAYEALGAGPAVREGKKRKSASSKRKEKRPKCDAKRKRQRQESFSLEEGEEIHISSFSSSSSSSGDEVDFTDGIGRLVDAAVSTQKNETIDEATRQPKEKLQEKKDTVKKPKLSPETLSFLHSFAADSSQDGTNEENNKILAEHREKNAISKSRPLLSFP